MKVLVATSLGQGERDNDFHWCIEGELVRIGFVCATDKRDPDGGCGCGRGFEGLNSHRSTTTARVTELPLSRNEYAQAISIRDEADDLANLAAQWPVGTIIERRLDKIRVRRSPTHVDLQAWDGVIDESP